jgi:hypothetical protein
MKFQILTEELPAWEVLATGHTHVASCLPPSWVSYPIRYLGDSVVDARGKVVKFLQDRLNEIKSDRDLIEIDVDLDPEIPHGTELGG